MKWMAGQQAGEQASRRLLGSSLNKRGKRACEREGKWSSHIAVSVAAAATVVVAAAGVGDSER